MLILDLLLHRYIRSGDMLTIYHGNSPTPSASYRVRVQGFGKYAAVFPTGCSSGAIRRDGIRKDANGNWRYRYDA